MGVLQTPALTTWLRRLEGRCWCRGGDSNPYTRRHGPLKTACLPVPPPRLLGRENPASANSTTLDYVDTKTACLPVPPPRLLGRENPASANSTTLDYVDTKTACLAVPPPRLRLVWQEWRDSNPRPAVLETAALPTELHSYGIRVYQRAGKRVNVRKRSDSFSGPRRPAVCRTSVTLEIASQLSSRDGSSVQ
jgi:hypothetical protein